MKITIDGQTYDVEVRGGEVVVDGKSFPVWSERVGNAVTVEINGKTRNVELQGETVVLDGKAYKVALERPAAPQPAPPPPRPAPAPQAPPPATAKPTPPPAPAAAAPKPAATAVGGTVMTAPMPGKILRVLVKEGDRVPYGGVLMVLEAMKMENEIRATVGGVVKSLPVSAGATVSAGETLAVIEG